MSEKQLWGGETTKAVDNFPVSGERVPSSVVNWLGRVKGAAARTNPDLGLLDGELAEKIAAAADEVAHGRHDDQFPIDVFQTGSGTSSNMNANEGIATLARDGPHPHTHVAQGPPLDAARPHASTRRPTACCPRSSASRPPSPPRRRSSRTSSSPAART